MKVYAPEDKSWVPAVEAPVEKGEEIDVDAETAEALIEQGWTSARQKAARRTGRKKRAEAKTEEAEPEPEPVVEAEPVTPSWASVEE